MPSIVRPSSVNRPRNSTSPSREATTIRTRLYRARKALRDRMEGQAPVEALQSLETMDDWAKQLRR